MLPAGVSPHAFNHELSHQAMHSLKAGEVCSRKLYSNWDVLIATNKPHFTKNISIIELTTFLPYILREDPLKTLTDFFFFNVSEIIFDLAKQSFDQLRRVNSLLLGTQHSRAENRNKLIKCCKIT